MKLEPNTKYVDVSGNVWGDWDGYYLIMYTGDEEIKKGERLAFNRNGGCAGSLIWGKYDISHKLEDKPNARETILEEAKKAVGDRGLNYGKPEENWDRIANLWNAYLLTKQDKALYAEDVACMMILLKVARLQNTPHHTDSWVDIAGYAACGGSLKGRGDE